MTTTKNTLRKELRKIQEKMELLSDFESHGYKHKTCENNEHYWVTPEIISHEEGVIKTKVICRVCGVTTYRRYELGHVDHEDDYEEFRDESLDQETTETDDKPTLPLEKTSQSDGTYKVDVASILGRDEE